MSRPSSLVKEDKCIWFQTDQVQADNSPYVQWGNRIDPWIKKLLDGHPLGSWKVEEIPEVSAAQWVVDQARELLTKIETQKRLELWDMFTIPAALIMPGTCDIYGWNKQDEVLEIWDVKSGQPRNYDAQLDAYALMAMDASGEVEVRTRIAYCDQKVLEERIVSRGEAEERVFGILERIRIGVELPEENEYCGQCARQSVCEVWTKPATEGMDLMNITPTIHLEIDQTVSVGERLEMLKSNPAMLGAFINAWRKAEKLVEKSGIEDFAKEELLAGREIPGWRLVEYQGRSFYNKEQIEAILQTWGESAADFLAVNRERYEGACANSDNDALQPEGHAKPFHKLLKNK